MRKLRITNNKHMKDSILYLECFSGISGDMTVAALLDLGADEEVLRKGLQSLNVHGYRIETGYVKKNGINVFDFNVVLEDGHPEHDHDHGHSHDCACAPKPEDGHIHTEECAHEHTQETEPMHEHDHEHDHSHESGHSHEHGCNSEHSHDHGHPDENHHSHSDGTMHLGHHEHRNLNDIYRIIDSGEITDRAKAMAKKIFLICAKAEAKAHGVPIEEVHFHEVGAVDSIVDIVAAAICLDNLNITEAVVSELYEGCGHISCAHGVLPVPVPAVANIAAENGLPMRFTGIQGEFVTPTGASIAAAVRTMDALPERFRILKIGLGGGKRSYERPSILRAMLIEDLGKEKKAPSAAMESVSVTQDSVVLLESNIDDSNGEALAIAMERLLAAGALDVWYTPVFMKKNRPGYLVGVLVSEELRPEAERILFENTTTIGIRRQNADRTILARKQLTVSTPYGDAAVKVCGSGEFLRCYPECESIRQLMKTSGLDYLTLYHLILNAVPDCPERKA